MTHDLSELYQRIRCLPLQPKLCNVNRNGRLWWGFKLAPSDVLVSHGHDVVAFPDKKSAQSWIQHDRSHSTVSDCWEQAKFLLIEAIAPLASRSDTWDRQLGASDPKNQEIPPEGLALLSSWGILD